MLDQFSRTRMQVGAAGIDRLKASCVAIFGIGGVGGFTAEALARAGVGHIDLFDDDKVCLTNLNRQIIATRKTIGQYKVDVMKDRILDINPDAEVGAFRMFYSLETADEVDFTKYDYIIDAIDTVTAKLELVCRAHACGTPVICSMGAANKLDPTAFEVTDIYKTSMCPLARVMRRELRKRGIPKLKVVYSTEQALTPIEDMESSCRNHCVCPPGTARKCTERRQIPSSNAFVPGAAGLILAGVVTRALSGV